MLKIIAIDDNPEILNDYVKYIPKWLEKNNIQGDLILVTDNHIRLMEELEKGTANVLLLDISFKGGEINGISVAQKIRAEKLAVDIIFVSNCPEFVRQALILKAYDFIHKHEFDQLEGALIRLAKEKEEQKQQSIEIKCNSQIFFIPISSITSIERVKTKTVVHSSKGDYSTYETLDKLVNRINDPRLKRCHKSVFVNIENIYLVDLKKKIIELTDGSTCDIGPKFFSDFYQEGRKIL